MYNYKSWGWTSLAILFLLVVGGKVVEAGSSSPTLKLQWAYTTGADSEPYQDLGGVLTWYGPNAGYFKLSPEVRIYPGVRRGKYYLDSQIKHNREDGWGKATLKYTQHDYPDTPYQRWNFGVEYKKSALAWWNQGAKGFWRVKLKGEDQRYPTNPKRNYFSGEWELYSESTEPTIPAPNIVGDFRSRGFFDYAVGQALDGKEYFLDAWLIGEILSDDAEELSPTWARSDDEISSKLLTRLSGGWNNRYTSPQYTSRGENYEIQWQQQTGKSKSIKGGLRTVNKVYPYELLKGYSTREHLLTRVEYGEKRRWEIGGTYRIKRPLVGGQQDNYKLWIETAQAVRKTWELRVQGKYQNERGTEKQKAELAGVLTNYFRGWSGLNLQGYWRLGLEQKYNFTQMEEGPTKARLSLKVTKDLGELLQGNLRVETSRCWSEADYADDWGLKLGLIRTL